MHALPGIYCTREIRWKMPYLDQSPPVHTYIDASTNSMKERLEDGRERYGSNFPDVTTTGAKLKFDPYGFVPPSHFSKFGQIVEDDVHVFILRRPYFEIFQTWKIFGIRHLANPNAKAHNKKRDAPTDQVEQDRINRFHEHHAVPVEMKKIHLEWQKNPLSRFVLSKARRKPDNREILHYQVREAIDDLFVLFYNDLLTISSFRDHNKSSVIDYSMIGDEFFTIAQKFCPDISLAECQDILENSATLKIEPDNTQLVFPEGALRDISDHLFSLTTDVLNGHLTVNDIVQFDEQNDVVSFHIPRLVDILLKHKETKALAYHPGKSKNIFHRVLQRIFQKNKKITTWTVNRPIYQPVSHSP
jgi:hypothetical protein